jgi:hypothetical protein
MSLLLLFSILMLKGLISAKTANLSVLATPAQRTYTSPTKFDPNRDAFEDLAAATEEAKRTQRNVLIEIGGLMTWVG